MKRDWIWVTLATLLATLACSVQAQMVQKPEPLGITPFPSLSPTAFQIPSSTEQFTTPTPYLDIPVLTVAGLKNAEYLLTINGVEQTIRLADGQYQTGTDSSMSGFITITMNEITASGDLNNDGIDDAVVILSEWQGGTGMNVFVAAVVNWAGIPRHEASALIGDRAIINSIHIENGLILVNAIVHGPDDPGCCPSQQTVRIFRLASQSLVEEK